MQDNKQCLLSVSVRCALNSLQPWCNSLSHLVSSAHMIFSPSYVLRNIWQALVESMHTCLSVAEMRGRLSYGSKARANGLHMEKRRKSGKYLENDGTSGFSSNACPVPLRLSCNGKRPIYIRKRVAVQQNAALRSLFMCSQQPEYYAAWSHPVQTRSELSQTHITVAYKIGTCQRN